MRQEVEELRTERQRLYDECVDPIATRKKGAIKNHYNYVYDLSVRNDSVDPTLCSQMTMTESEFLREDEGRTG